MLRAVLLALALAGCASDPAGLQRLAEEFQVFQGLRAGPAELRDGGERLDVFVGVPAEGWAPPDPVEFRDVLYCVASNPAGRPLPEVVERLNLAPSHRPLVMYGRRLSGRHEHWWGGIDCEVSAIGIWHEKARGYVYYDLEHRRPWWEWRAVLGAMRLVVETAVDVAK